jgi:hypothetical protein
MVAQQTVNLPSFGIPVGSIPTLSTVVNYKEQHMMKKPSCGASHFASVAQG